MLGYVAARTERIVLSAPITLITTNGPVKIAEDYAMLSTASRSETGLGCVGGRPLARQNAPSRVPVSTPGGLAP